MEVKTGELRDQLSRYLKRVRQTGDTIVVLDRNVPVAELRPYSDTNSSLPPKDVWSNRARYESEIGQLDEDFELPSRTTDRRKAKNPLD
jgi:prevent-host-death family protein